MNARWHELHPMPKNATLAQRVTWHTAHAKHCACRPMPKTVVDALKAKPPAAAQRARKTR